MRWPTIPFSETGRWLSGGTPARDNPAFWGGSIPWVGSKDVKGFDLDGASEHVTEDGVANGTRVVDAGTVLFVTRGMSLAKEFRVGVAARPLAFNQDVKAIVPRRELDGRFLARFLSASEEFILDRVDTATHGTKRLPLERIEDMPVPMPPLPEQRRIAEILDRADAIRRRREEAVGLIDDLQRSAFLEMFGDPIANPKSLPVVLLGGDGTELRYGTSEPCTSEVSANGLPVLRIPNVVGGEIDWMDLKYGSLPPSEVERLELVAGDLVFVRSNGNPEFIGRCAVFDGQRRALFASYLIRARFGRGARVRPEFARVQMSLPSYRHLVVGEARTTAGNYNISASALRTLPILAPPIASQDQFLRTLTAIGRLQKRMSSAARRDTALLASLTHRAFTGAL